MKLQALTRATAVITAVTATAALGALPAQAATTETSWRPTVLTMPSGGVNASLTASDGKGEYTGTATIDGVTQVVSWRGTCKLPVVRGLPAGYEEAKTVDENGAGTVVGTADDRDNGARRAFTLDATGFHVKDVPAGWDNAAAVAINARGDVLGDAFKWSGDKSVAVLWPASGDAPVLIPEKLGSWNAIDLDDDGTILFEEGIAGPSVWKDGVLRQLPASPYSQALGSSISNGVVVGETPDGGGLALRWDTASSNPVVLPGGVAAVSVNDTGLSAGLAPSSTPGAFYGNAIAWEGTTPVTLPQPGDYLSFRAEVAVDDGSFAGYAWNELANFGVPVIWRKSAA
jgi:hypothetical protein